jgi:hypothetical protein
MDACQLGAAQIAAAPYVKLGAKVNAHGNLINTSRMVIPRRSDRSSVFIDALYSQIDTFYYRMGV